MINRFKALISTDRAASSSIEFAVCGSVLLFMLFGVIQIQLLFGVQSALGYAVDRAGRFASLHGSTSSNPASQSVVSSALAAATPSFISQAGLHVSMTNAPSAIPPGSLINISVTYTWTPTALSFLGVVHLTSQTTYVMQN